ncbi:HdaA/DnaA family protein [Mesobacterium pallidum]|uniref:HdaA/DnaA family protein n=1 Tax=Mesobacterium pallidum TaxID=2872037 RepID=UPI001EE222D5|nr:DnaA/Hda family protein [Mesobacterium pallidum]
MPRQLTFDLAAKPALGREDFFVSPANAVAVAQIGTWPGWPGNKLALIGPEGSGKTHLAHVWAATSGARIVPAAALAEADVPALASGPVAIEDVPAIAGDGAAQRTLFHLHNLVLANGQSLLVTGRGEPAFWGLTLPDLASRMQGTPTVGLNPPDDALLGAVILKLFADQQLAPPPDVIAYLVTRIERSFASAQSVVARLDAASMADKRPLTRAYVGRLLDNSAQNG